MSPYRDGMGRGGANMSPYIMVAVRDGIGLGLDLYRDSTSRLREKSHYNTGHGQGQGYEMERG